MAFGGRFRDLLKKYGKVALGVHLSVSAVSISGLYVAIKNNVDVESLLSKVGLSGDSKQDPASNTPAPASLPDLPDDVVFEDRPPVSDLPEQKKNRSTELAVSSGGALALAVLCNKALFPVRVPITIFLTPAVSRFLARRRIIKNHV
ncbi:hypothetical protein CKAN_01331500 [Cinnamomum micranthum f. kanehirae]|uniref:DUF1279 domain-containing protein n=1 Tax=Cinnamomum micranthum f. kanehirae TaxID=337451 RepID=A0A443P171_9MAGN|nr:hypothetical protein CKAN_01331500 [Cinnamomum micranthum f. kanehirae]